MKSIYIFLYFRHFCSKDLEKVTTVASALLLYVEEVEAFAVRMGSTSGSIVVVGSGWFTNKANHPQRLEPALYTARVQDVRGKCQRIDPQTCQRY